MQEDEFVDLVLEKYEKRKKYADYLEKEGSIMAKSFRERESIFRLRNTGSNEGPETEHWLISLMMLFQLSKIIKTFMRKSLRLM